MDKASEAAIEFLKRKFRIAHPAGKTDRGGRWYPDGDLTCCKSIRSPSRDYPWSLMTHCRSAKHIAIEYGVEEKDMKDRLRKENLPLLIGYND